MANFNDSLQSLVNQQMITKAAKTVDEKASDISTAVSTIIPSLLGVLLKRKGHSPQVENMMTEAGNLNILSSIENLCEEKPTEDQRKIGDDFLQFLLGDKAADFTNPIADKAGISRVATNRLISMIAPIVVGYLGNKIVRENWSKAQIFNQLEKEKSDFKSAIPSALVKSFGLENLLNTDTPTKREEPKKSGGKWWIILLILLLLLLLFFGWRSCKNDSDMVNMQEVVTEEVVEPVKSVVMPDKGEMEDMTLPDGSVIKVYNGGIEEKMIKFMESDEYKNATEEDLKNKWFQFDDINFEFGSATDLKPESERQINNIATILKGSKDFKVRIAGFADKKGTEEANMHISQQRAKTIESMLEAKGIGNQIVKTEGYGDEFAKHSASESNDQRAEDRDIALRFVK